MITSLFFIFRLAATWFFTLFIAMFLLVVLTDSNDGPPGPLIVLCALLLAYMVTRAFSHVRRVRLIVGRVDGSTLANRQRRQLAVSAEALFVHSDQILLQHSLGI